MGNGQSISVSGDQIMEELGHTREAAEEARDKCSDLEDEVHENNKHLEELNGKVGRHEEILDPFTNKESDEVDMGDVKSGTEILIAIKEEVAKIVWYIFYAVIVVGAAMIALQLADILGLADHLKESLTMIDMLKP